MIAIWRAVIGFLGGPVVKGLLSAYQSYLTAQTTDRQTAAKLAAQEIAAQQALAETQAKLKRAEIGHAFEPEKLAFYVVLAYFAKGVVWDTMFGFGTTGPLTGNLNLWAGMVMSFYFTKRGFENVARILKR